MAEAARIFWAKVRKNRYNQYGQPPKYLLLRRWLDRWPSCLPGKTKIETILLPFLKIFLLTPPDSIKMSINGA